MTDPFREFAKALRFGKYTDWVCEGEFSKEQLKCLLWAVGEFNVSASSILELLWKHRAELHGAERAYLALVGIRNMALGERFCVDEWSRRFGREFDRRIGRPIDDLPEPGRSALHQASAGVMWDIVMMIHEGYEVTGKDATGQRLYAMLSTEGAIEYIGPARQLGNQPSPSIFSIFSTELEQELNRGLRTHWAAARTFTAEHLRCLLWMIGEFSYRSYTVFKILTRGQAQLADHRCAVAALEAISLMVHGWPDTDDLARRIGYGRAHPEFNE